MPDKVILQLISLWDGYSYLVNVYINAIIYGYLVRINSIAWVRVSFKWAGYRKTIYKK